MRRVIIESPYAGAVERNEVYARLAMLDCIARGESPYASHLLLTQVLDDLNPDQRDLGIRAGFAWREVATRVFYLDLGWSSGMLRAVDDLHSAGVAEIETRRLPPVPFGANLDDAIDDIRDSGPSRRLYRSGQILKAYREHYATIRPPADLEVATEPFNPIPVLDSNAPTE